jgi:hypothetical protein
VIWPQVGIVGFGVAAIWLSQEKAESRRRWASVCGLLAQPFWVVETVSHSQWGLLATCALYAWSWWRGFRLHWLSRWSA